MLFLFTAAPWSDRLRLVKLVVMVLIIIPRIVVIVLYFTRGFRLNDFIGSIILVIFSILDISMTILFLKAVHLKNTKLLKIYYKYYYAFSIVNVLVYMAAVIFEVLMLQLHAVSEFFVWWDVLTYFVVIGFVNFGKKHYDTFTRQHQFLNIFAGSSFNN